MVVVTFLVEVKDKLILRVKVLVTVVVIGMGTGVVGNARMTRNAQIHTMIWTVSIAFSES